LGERGITGGSNRTRRGGKIANAKKNEKTHEHRGRGGAQGKKCFGTPPGRENEEGLWPEEMSRCNEERKGRAEESMEQVISFLRKEEGTTPKKGEESPTDGRTRGLYSPEKNDSGRERRSNMRIV